MFSSTRFGDWDLFVMSSAGGAATLITGEPLNDLHPAWSPDGSQIAYSTLDVFTLATEIRVRPASGGPLTSLAEGSQPAWAPDGTQIAFTSNRSGNFDIWTIPASGGTASQITTDSGSDESPAWSPDGTRIAFSSNRSGLRNIWIIAATGGSATQVTTAGGSAPTWSPDGDRIAFYSDRSGNLDIWIVSSDGTGARQVTADPTTDFFPSWSPDGTKIAFASFRSGNRDVWVIAAPQPTSLEAESWGSIKAAYRE